MNNRVWEQTGKGQYILKDVSYTGYAAKQDKQKKGNGFFLFAAGFAAGILLVLMICFVAFRFSNSLSMATQKKIGLLESVIDKHYMG